VTGKTHQAIRESIRGRIKAGEWPLGALIPGEAEFAEEYGCARTTVNRALRALADEGIVERKRKGGTRIRPLPVAQAQLTIPILREQVEATGQRYRHRILAREIRVAQPDVLQRMRLAAAPRLVWIETLHLANDKPFALERRWINLDSVPEFEAADLTELSANEWLVRTMPFSRGEVSLSATSADAEQAMLMGVEAGCPLFTLQRTTWLDEKAITTMTLHYPPPYKLEFSL